MKKKLIIITTIAWFLSVSITSIAQTERPLTQKQTERLTKKATNKAERCRFDEIINQISEAQDNDAQDNDLVIETQDNELDSVARNSKPNFGANFVYYDYQVQKNPKREFVEIGYTPIKFRSSSSNFFKNQILLCPEDKPCKATYALDAQTMNAQIVTTPKNVLNNNDVLIGQTVTLKTFIDGQYSHNEITQFYVSSSDNFKDYECNDHDNLNE